MKLLGVFKTLGNLVLKKAKENPKMAAVVVGSVIGGSVGAKIKKVAEKLPG